MQTYIIYLNHSVSTDIFFLFQRKNTMEKITCLLFDMDGVILDTESQYDIFWKRIGKEYNIGISNFEKKIKRTTLPEIFKKNF